MVRPATAWSLLNYLPILRRSQLRQLSRFAVSLTVIGLKHKNAPSNHTDLFKHIDDEADKDANLNKQVNKERSNFVR